MAAAKRKPRRLPVYDRAVRVPVLLRLPACAAVELTSEAVDDVVQRFGGSETQRRLYVRLFAGDDGKGGVRMSPAVARQLAAELIENADAAERGL